MLKEDTRRRIERARREGGYDPLTGRGACGVRKRVRTPVEGLTTALVPESMTRDAAYTATRADATAWRRLRCRHDFEYWCATCCTVKHKTLGTEVAFVLNAPQRRVAAMLEADRRAGVPIRMIMLKARQWGGSTLVQMYMAWMQSCVRRNWHSLICAHVKDTAAAIRGMYTRVLANYPRELWDGDEEPRFRSYERSVNMREIAGRGCRVTVGSAESQEAVRGSDYSMAHLSETAFWPSTPKSSPADFIRAVCGAIALVPDTLIVMESTANGTGSYFHSEWLRCSSGAGDKRAVFVAWYEIEIYRLEPPDPGALAASLTAYERGLWELGLCLDQIYWYRCKLREYSDPRQMMAEFPTSDLEAFLNTGSSVFSPAAVERLRGGCIAGARGEIGAGGFAADPTGGLTLWRDAEEDERYVVAVDIGGRTAKADWSVIAVVRRPSLRYDVPEVVAQWRGHIDHDMLVERAEGIARHYNRGLLIIESNTLETEAGDDANLFVLSRLAARYGNVYRRRSLDRSGAPPGSRPGFHTNRATKAYIINELVEAVRKGAYVERDHEACNELMSYEHRPNGTYAARAGCHDDIVMTRALALHALNETAVAPSALQPLPPRRRLW